MKQAYTTNAQPMTDFQDLSPPVDIPFHSCTGFLFPSVYQCKYLRPIYVLHVFGQTSELELVLFFLNVLLFPSLLYVFYMYFHKNTSAIFRCQKRACNAIAAAPTYCRC